MRRTRGHYVQDKERWKELCEQAVEQDSTKLMELVREINKLMLEKENRLRVARSRTNGSVDISKSN